MLSNFLYEYLKLSTILDTSFLLNLTFSELIHFTEAASVMTHRIGIRLYKTDKLQKECIMQVKLLMSHIVFIWFNLEKIELLAHL